MTRAAAALLLLLAALCPAAAQQPGDAADISAELLYHAAWGIEPGPAPGEVTLRARGFTYRFHPASGAWEVRAETSLTGAPRPSRLAGWRTSAGAELRFHTAETEQAGILEIVRVEGDAARPLAALTLWTRAALGHAWLAALRRSYPRLGYDQLVRDFEPAEPEVAAAAEHAGRVWLAIAHDSAEGWLGLGTLVEVDVESGAARLHQPAALATASFHAMVVAGGALWLATEQRGEGSATPAAGLARFDLASGEVKSYLGGDSPLGAHLVTALAAAPGEAGELLWAATDEGVCRIALPAEEWTCWRIVPVVTLAAPAPVSNRPGGPPRGELPPGRYEARWANAGYFLVLTPDAAEGWLDINDYEDYLEQRFDRDAWTLGNTYGGGATVMRLLERPGGDPLGAAVLYRTPLERLTEPDENDYLRVRARAGWIARGGLTVVPALEPAPRQKQ